MTGFAARVNVVLLFVMTAAQPALGDVYRYVDERGVHIFTDNPGHTGFILHMRDDGRDGSNGSGGYYPYRAIIREAAAMYGLEEPLLRAVMEVESDYNRYAMSRAGARGLMQLMPATMEHLGVSNPWDPIQNVQGGAKYLKSLMNRFSGKVNLALAAYNAGATAVLRYGRVPPYPQTERYVNKVLRLYREYSCGIVD